MEVSGWLLISRIDMILNYENGDRVIGTGLRNRVPVAGHS